MKKIIFLLLLIPSLTFAQMTKRDSLWMPMKPFVGDWSGTGDGEPGPGKYERSYEFILGKRFIEVKNKSVYEPKAGKTEGEIHEDRGFISYDKSRKNFILRQFHLEGFVNQFALESISEDGKKIVFTTESIENLPAGFRARETYQFINDNEFEETFELAEPGKDFFIYSTVKLKRKE